MTPYGGIYADQYWLKWWLAAWRHQAITWNNYDWLRGAQTQTDINPPDAENGIFW